MPKPGSRGLVAVVGLLLAAGGLAAALWFAAVPRSLDVSVERPVLRRTGEFNQTLVATGGTEMRSETRTCVAVRPLLWPAGTDRACDDVDSRNLGFAAWGFATFLVGAGLWITSGAEERIREGRKSPA